jgi:ABC-type branched-subunit amino acid transport system permease subunit
MIWKILFGLLAAALLVVFIGPVVLKLKDLPLTVVVLIGVAMMAIDLWQSFKSKE